MTMPEPITPNALAHLTAQERQALTFFKWAYVLRHVDGFTRAQAARLCFVRWLWLRGRLCE
jgi:hypothetical protein